MHFIIFVLIGTATASGIFYWIGNLISPDVILPQHIVDSAADDNHDDFEIRTDPMYSYDIRNIYHDDTI